MNLYFLNSPEELTKQQVGGKGFYLHQMAQDNLPIPDAAFLTTDMWKQWREDPKGTSEKLKKEYIPKVIEYFKNNNNGKMPLVSVRSAGAVSMPGMMDTILNVGIDPDFFKETPGTATKTTSKKSPSSKIKNKVVDDSNTQKSFMLDSCSRFLTMYGNTVLGISKDDLESSVKFKTLEEVESHFEKIYKKNKKALPSKDPAEQIFNCVLAVFESWDSERAKLYRKLNDIDNDAGTAVVIQRMVFGNKNDQSSSGVLFSRNPSNGQNRLTGEYLTNAQGEDVVSGSHTPKNIDELEDDLPEAFDELKKIAEGLESKYKEMQDIEFTIEDGRVFILQARTAKCSPFAKLKMLMDMHKFNDITAQEILDRLTLKEYLDLNVKQVDPSWSEKPAGIGLPASMGAISGRVVFGASSKYKGEPTIFCAKETTPNDLQAIQMAAGILTASGGVTSHAAVVARGMGKVCVVGCEALKIQKKNGTETATIGGQVVESGDWITLDASQGKVWLGNEVPILDAQNTQIFWDLEELVQKANPQWTKITSKVDELLKGQKTYFLTYALEGKDDEYLENELKDATEFLTGTLDVTGKLDFLQQKYANQFLFADISAENSFLKKKKILREIAFDAEDKNFAFDVYLGPYEEEHTEDFKRMGFKVRKSDDISLDPKNKTASLIVSQHINSAIKPEKMAISSRNALLGILK